MKLVIISGRSGSGKSTALNVLEDAGFYAIDNLPVGLLPSLVEQADESKYENKLLAVCIDARNHTDDIQNFLPIIRSLPEHIETQIIYLDALSPVLIRRFSETRRKHPLSNKTTSLKQAIQKEKELLDPIAAIADLHIDTSQMNVHTLRSTVKKRIALTVDSGMSILFTSFGFKNGIPVDADIVYDVRCLPNPYWEPSLRHLTGLDEAIQAFFATQEDVGKMFNDIRNFLNDWLPKFSENNRSYVTVSIGCTGGMHRSVFIAEQLKAFFNQQYDNVLIHHRDLLI